MCTAATWTWTATATATAVLTLCALSVQRTRAGDVGEAGLPLGPFGKSLRLCLSSQRLADSGSKKKCSLPTPRTRWWRRRITSIRAHCCAARQRLRTKYPGASSTAPAWTQRLKTVTRAQRPTDGKECASRRRSAQPEEGRQWAPARQSLPLLPQDNSYSSSIRQAPAKDPSAACVSRAERSRVEEAEEANEAQRHSLMREQSTNLSDAACLMPDATCRPLPLQSRSAAEIFRRSVWCTFAIQASRWPTVSSGCAAFASANETTASVSIDWT